jgi:nucleoside-diphosphate-sugar epimerase
MADERLFKGLSGKNTYDYVIHCAQANYSEHSAEAIHEMDRKAVANLERIRTDATKMMVYTSGVWIFGTQEGFARINELTPLRPFSAAQARAILVTELLSQKNPWTQLCPPSIVYGAVGPLATIVRGMRSGPIDVIDDESIQWSVIERMDLANAYLSLLRHGMPGESYVVAEDDAVQVVDFYATIARLVPGAQVVRRSRSYFASSLNDAGLETKYANQPVDSTKIKRSTGWRARDSFRTSVNRLVAAI